MYVWALFDYEEMTDTLEVIKEGKWNDFTELFHVRIIDDMWKSLCVRGFVFLCCWHLCNVWNPCLSVCLCCCVWTWQSPRTRPASLSALDSHLTEMPKIDEVIEPRPLSSSSSTPSTPSVASTPIIPPLSSPGEGSVPSIDTIDNNVTTPEVSFPPIPPCLHLILTVLYVNKLLIW